MVPKIDIVAATEDTLIRYATDTYLDGLDPDDMPSVDTLKSELVCNTQNLIEEHNVHFDKTRAIPYPRNLTADQVYSVVSFVYTVRRIACAGDTADGDYDLLAIYQETGPSAGLYITSELELSRIIMQYNHQLSAQAIAGIVSALRVSAPRLSRSSDPDLIAVNNGIFNFKTKTLLPFSPEFVFLSKSKVDYVANPANPVLHNAADGTDWDIESWMSELSDDPEIVSLFWEILGAIIRPFVHWNKSAWFYSNTGNNGKGTLCALMRNLCGAGSYASIPLSDFSKDFVLEPLTRATAIIVDENDVGLFIDKAANLKAVITNDVIQINRKFKIPIAYQFYGFMVQCLNEFPRIKDKSDSFYRRQLFVPFEKCFTGMERRYIKSDYLARPEVLEYVLHKVLHMNNYVLSEPAACATALNQYKEFNDPVRQFTEEILSQCVWDLLPFRFLYDLYLAWFKKNSPSGSPQGKNTFIVDLINLLPTLPDWTCLGRTVTVRTAGRIATAEPLIGQYNLTDWMNPTYTGSDPAVKYIPPIKTKYNGLIRASAALNDDDEEPAFD